MHDIVLVKDLESIDELLEDKEGVSFGNNSLLAEHSFKGASIAVLIDEVEVVGSFEHIDVLDDMLILLYIGEDVDLIDGALF